MSLKSQHMLSNWSNKVFYVYLVDPFKDWSPSVYVQIYKTIYIYQKQCSICMYCLSRFLFYVRRNISFMCLSIICFCSHKQSRPMQTNKQYLQRYLINDVESFGSIYLHVTQTVTGLVLILLYIYLVRPKCNKLHINFSTKRQMILAICRY